MKVFQVYFESISSNGSDIVVCEEKNNVKECLEERGYRNVFIQSCREISTQQVRVRDLTVGDLIKLIKD